jgi:hypothetical protein
MRMRLGMVFATRATIEEQNLLSVGHNRHYRCGTKVPALQMICVTFFQGSPNGAKPISKLSSQSDSANEDPAGTPITPDRPHLGIGAVKTLRQLREWDIAYIVGSFAEPATWTPSINSPDGKGTCLTVNPAFERIPNISSAKWIASDSSTRDKRMVRPAYRFHSLVISACWPASRSRPLYSSNRASRLSEIVWRCSDIANSVKVPNCSPAQPTMANISNIFLRFFHLQPWANSSVSQLIKNNVPKAS